MKYGIDISEWNGEIDLATLKPEFVIIRAGYGIKHTDKMFKRNVKECERLNIPYGLYWFSEALNTEEAEEEALYFLSLADKCNVSVGCWFDMEDSPYKTKNGFRKTATNITAICERFCDIVEMSGYYTGIYCSKYWYDTYIRTKRFDIWLAWWGANFDTKNVGSLLQYTDKLNGAVLDGDVCYTDLARFKKSGNDKHRKLIDELANRTLDGEFGNGEERKKTLGVIYSEVQERVNEKIYGTK